ncbi:protein adenylyltransferase FICD-like [Hippocampus zosterae]|uniref:protein adenylyltransferase FICD-like n=1 Tax=Hippocampus zosterae TaxID=109293 RepID=UPI00223DF454|nr:protein adenylyltransferase FICD-like [Hippocampus zosterae]
MFDPNFTIRPRLLRTMREIGETLGVIRVSHLSDARLARLTHAARALSAHASTSIEGNPLPLTDVKRLLKQAPGQVRDTEREVLNYNRALEWVQEQVKAERFELNTATFETVQGMVVDGLMENPFDVGRIRQKPVVIRDPRAPDSTVFLPPDHGDVKGLCDDMFAYLRDHVGELDPVLLAGLFHKQAVIIHPFMDGNGRSTRLMTTGILGMTGLDVFPIFSFEEYYNRNVTRYFQMVGEQGDFYDLTGGADFSVWLEYFAEGILDELKRVQKTLPAQQPRLEPHHRLILEHLESHGSITQQEYGGISNRSLASRKNDFARLVELGLIRPVGGGRSIHYVLAE